MKTTATRTILSFDRPEQSNKNRSSKELVYLSSVGKMAPNYHAAALPENTTGVNLSHITTPGMTIAEAAG